MYLLFLRCLFFLHFHFSLFFMFTLFLPSLPVPHYTPPSSGLYRCCQPYRRKRAGVFKLRRKIPSRVTDPWNRKFQNCIIPDSISSQNLVPIRTIKWRLPIFLNSNTRSLMNKIDEITILMDVNHVDIACLTETWLSGEILPCVTGIEGYACERRDRGIEEGTVSLFISVMAFHITELIPLSAMRLSHCGCSSEINACLVNSRIFSSALYTTRRATVILPPPTTL